MSNPRVLSIQSHVVYGYVGNKSATFPLQLLGFEVDAINSVQFSNHTGYGVFKGQILSDTDLDQLMEGLKANKLDQYSHLLTGYVGSPSFLQQIAETVKYLKTRNPALKYVCDPVMGDNGCMYVPESLLPIYRDVIVPLADIITPNQFEAELLTGTKISSVADAWAAMDILHEKGCNTVVLSSSDLTLSPNNLLGLASTITSEGGVKKKTRVSISIPRLSATFTGTGDLFAALFLAWMHRTNNRVAESLEKTVATVQAVLNRTLLDRKNEGDGCKTLELKLIQSKADIENPTVVHKAEVISGF